MTANSIKTEAPKPKPKPNKKPTKGSWKPGQSGNPKGRPKDGESWSAVFTEVYNMNAEDILVILGRANDLGRDIAFLPRNVQAKYLVAFRTIAALMFDPSSALLGQVMDRMDGKVSDVLRFEPLDIEGMEAALDRVYAKKKDSNPTE